MQFHNSGADFIFYMECEFSELICVLCYLLQTCEMICIMSCIGVDCLHIMEQLSIMDLSFTLIAVTYNLHSTDNSSKVMYRCPIVSNTDT